MPHDSFTDTVYATLCDVAESALRQSRPDTVILPAELVHECFVKLSDASDLRVESALHFRALAARVIRQLLVDRLRARASQKRGGCWERVALDDDLTSDGSTIDVLALDDALERLAELDPRQARVVELRFFGGLTTVDIATALEVSERTIDSEWALARAWLRRDLA